MRINYFIKEIIYYSDFVRDDKTKYLLLKVYNWEISRINEWRYIYIYILIR